MELVHKQVKDVLPWLSIWPVQPRKPHSCIEPTINREDTLYRYKILTFNFVMLNYQNETCNCCIISRSSLKVKVYI